MQSTDDDNKSEPLQEEAASNHLTEAVRKGGHEVDNAEQAWGKIIDVQVQIALDASMGTKATSAAKFLAQAAGFKQQKSLGFDDISGKISLSDSQLDRLMGFFEGEHNGRTEED